MNYLTNTTVKYVIEYMDHNKYEHILIDTTEQGEKHIEDHYVYDTEHIRMHLYTLDLSQTVNVTLPNFTFKFLHIFKFYPKTWFLKLTNTDNIITGINQAITWLATNADDHDYRNLNVLAKINE